MKKILCLVLLISSAYSQFTGNTFLKDYPFGKKWEDMTTQEMIYHTGYTMYVTGFIMGDFHMGGRVFLATGTTSVTLLNEALIGMKNEQIIRIMKKWCVENPEQTNKPLDEIVINALLPLIPPHRDEK